MLQDRSGVRLGVGDRLLPESRLPQGSQAQASCQSASAASQSTPATGACKAALEGRRHQSCHRVACHVTYIYSATNLQRPQRGPGEAH